MNPQIQRQLSPAEKMTGENKAITPLVIPTSRDYGPAMYRTISLLQKYWPAHPPITTVGRDRKPELPTGSNVLSYVAGKQSQVTWCEALLWYLKSWCDHEMILLLLDDYGFFQMPDTMRLERALSVMEANPRVASFHLTHMCVKSCTETNFGSDILAYPRWNYSVNTQAAYWRVSCLVELLKTLGSATINNFEGKGSKIWNRRFFEQYQCLTFRSPQSTPLLLDRDPCKNQWVMPYHNLVHRGAWDSHHREFLKSEGFDGQELLQ